MSIEIITEHREMYRKADEFGLRDLLPQTASQVHLLANTHSGEAKFVINKSVSGETAFVVIMVTSAGLFADAVMLLDWGDGELPEPVLLP